MLSINIFLKIISGLSIMKKKVNFCRVPYILFIIIFISSCSNISGKVLDSGIKLNAIERYFSDIYLLSSCEWPYNKLVVLNFCLKSPPYYDSKLQKVDLYFIPVRDFSDINTTKSEIKEILLRELENLQYELGLPDEDAGLLMQTPIFLATDYSEINKSIHKEILSALNIKLEINFYRLTGVIEKSNSSEIKYTLDNHGILVH